MARPISCASAAVLLCRTSTSVSLALPLTALTSKTTRSCARIYRSLFFSHRHLPRSCCCNSIRLAPQSYSKTWSSDNANWQTAILDPGCDWLAMRMSFSRLRILGRIADQSTCSKNALSGRPSTISATSASEGRAGSKVAPSSALLKSIVVAVVLGSSDSLLVYLFWMARGDLRFLQSTGMLRNCGRILYYLYYHNRGDRKAIKGRRRWLALVLRNRESRSSPESILTHESLIKSRRS
jgi:hypothetical protein